MSFGPSKPRGRPPSGGRQAVLDEALAIVREQGVARLTSREIAARAGVSDASVFYYFKDRRGLLLAVYAHGLGALNLTDDLASDVGREAVLIRAFDSLERFFSHAMPVIHAAQADADLGEALAAHLEEHNLGPRTWVSALSDYLRTEQTAHRVNPEADVGAVALLLVDAAFGRASRLRVMRSTATGEQLPSRTRLVASLNLMLDLPGA